MALIRRFARSWLCLAFALASIQGLAANPPGVDSGLAWLAQQPQPGGNVNGESASIATPFQARAETLTTLRQLATAPTPVANLVAGEAETTTEYIARKIATLAPLGRDVSASMAALGALQNADGGFGGGAGYQSNPLDTALALIAFKAAGSTSSAAVSNALAYLTAAQATDGSFAINEQPSVYVTAYALQAFDAHALTSSLAAPMQSARTYLVASQANGAYSSVLEDAVAAIALTGATTDSSTFAGLQPAIVGAQSADGSWSDDPYLTAIAIRALSAIGAPPPASTTATVTGIVLDDATGAAVAGALVQASGPTSQSAITDANGAFQLTGLAPGTYSVQVSGAGYATVTRSVATTAGVTSNLGTIRLSSTGGAATLQGVVRDGSSGQPVSGATVAISGGSSAQTDAAGAYQIAGIAAGSATVSVTKSGYQAISETASFVAGITVTFSPSLYPTGSTPGPTTVAPLVLSAANQQPIAGATVTAGSASGVTDATGRATLGGLVEGMVAIQASAPGFASQSAAALLAPGANDGPTLSLAVAQSITLSGRVTDSASGAGIGGATVRVQNSTLAATSDATGQYQLPGLTSTQFTLSIAAPGYITKTVTVTLPQLASSTLDVALDRSQTGALVVTGTTTDLPTYQPYGAIDVTMAIQSSSAVTQTLTFGATIFNANGIPVLQTTGESFAVNANTGTTVTIEVHNTNQPAGNYSVVMQGVDANGVVQVEGSASFAIAGLARISGSVTLDPPVAQVGASQPISIDASLSNHGNVTVPAGQVELTITQESSDPAYSPLGQTTVGAPFLSNGFLNYPVGAVYDAHGDLWILNSLNGRILHVTKQADGSYASEVWLDPATLPPPNPFPSPVALTIDGAGNLYVANFSSTIYKIDPAKNVSKITTNIPRQTAIASNGTNLLYVATDGTGNMISSVDVNSQAVVPVIGQGFTQPSGIAVAADGTAYVSNAGNNSIAKVSPAGEVTPFITSGLSGPRGLALNGSDLLIANSGTNTILKASTTSTPPALQPYGSGTSLNSPGPLALAADGTLYVGNTSASASSIATVPQGGGVAQTFVKSLVPNATGMTYDAAGNLYVVGSGGEVVKLDAAGTITSLAPAPGAANVAALASGTIVVSTTGGTLVPYPSNGSDIVTGLKGPSGVAPAGGTQVYVAEQSANRISIVDMATKGRSTLIDSFVNSGDDLYFAPSGDRYVLNSSRIDRVGATSGATLPASGLTFVAQGFTPNPAGGFYLEESSTLKSMSAAGAVSAIATTPALPSLAPGITLDVSSNILVGDRTGRKILRVNPATGAVDNTFADLSTFSASPLSSIIGDGSGGVFAAISDGKIIRVPSTGGNPSLVTTIPIPAWRLAFDATGNVLYVKTANDVRSINLASPGQVTTLAIPGGTSGTLQFANGQVHVINGTSEIRSYTPQGALLSTLAGFSHPSSLVWDGSRIIVVDDFKTISIVPGQLAQTLADERVNYLAASGGRVYGTRSSSIFTLAPGARVYTSYFTQAGLFTLGGIAARSDGGFTFASLTDQRFLTIDASTPPNVVASYAGVGSPTGIAVDAAGNVFFQSGSVRQITKVDPVTRQSVVFDSNSISTGLSFLNGTLFASGGFTLYSYGADGTRNVLFADPTANASYSAMTAANGRVYVTDSIQLKVSAWNGTAMTPVASGLVALSALAIGSDGALYAGSRVGSLTRVLGGQIRQLAGDLGNVTAVAVAPSSGRIFTGNSTGYLTAYEAGTFKRADISNLAQIAGATSFLGIQYLAPDANDVLAAGIGSNPFEAYRITYTPPPPPPAPGTVVYRAQAGVGDLAVGGNPASVSFGKWPAQNPGEYTFSVHRLDAVSGEAVNALHVGPAASGIVNIGATTVPPGNPSVRVTTRVTGGDFVSVARVDTSKTALVINNTARAIAMGADASGRIYVSTGGQTYRTKLTGGVETLSVPQGTSGRGAIPFDSDQNFYLVVGNGRNEISGFASATLQQVSHVTMAEQIVSIVVDSQNTIWALSTAPGPDGFNVGHLYHFKPGQTPQVLATASIRSPYSMSIDGKDNLYVQTSWFSKRTDGITRVTRDGSASLVIGPDAATGDPQYEYEGVSMTGDCADNIFTTPAFWKKYGQGAGWSFPQFEEEHVLMQVNGTTGKVAQVFDGVLFSTDLSDMDGIAYDRYGGQILVFSERWITGGSAVIYRIPVTCGAISTDLHMVVPPGQATSGYSVAPTSIVSRADGSSELVWSVKDVALAGQSVSFDTALANVGLGEKRPVASEAFLLFQDAFTSNQVKVPLAVPFVTGDGLVDLGVTVSPSSYPANTPISGTVTLTSRDPAQAHTNNLSITVTDAQGATVAQAAQLSVTVPAGGSVPVPVVFNTGSYLSGSYLVKARLSDATTGAPISSASDSFDILADDSQAIASVSSDKRNYQPIDTVTIDARAKNVSTNAVLSGLKLALVVSDPAGTQIFSGSRTVSQLVPGALQDAFFQVPLSAAASGAYAAGLTLTDANDAVLDTRSTTFNVLSTVATGSGLQGSLSAPRFANAGSTENLDATVIDNGNAAITGLPITFRVVNPANGAAVFEQSITANVAPGPEQHVVVPWDTTGLAAGTYIAAASATFPAGTVLLGQANVTIGVIQPFAFTSRADVPVSTATQPSVIESNPITVAGIVAPAKISVDVGEYQVNNLGWKGAEGTVNPGDTVSVRVTASPAFNTATTATLTIAGFSAPFSVTTVNPDITPDAFAFAPLANVPLATLETSDPVKISGIDIPVPISIVGGEYSINGTAWTALAGTIANGDMVAVRLTSANALGTTTSLVLTVSGVTGVFNVTTTAEDRSPDPFSFTLQTGVPLSTLRTSNQVTITGINVAVPISVVGGEYQVNTNAFTSAAGTVVSGDKVTVRHTSSASFSTTVTTKLTVSDFTATFESSTEGEDKSPDAFSFAAQTNVPIAQAQVSNSITITGINTTVPISVAGGEYSLGGTAYTSAAGTAKSGDQVTVRQTSASTFATTTTATLTVSDFSAPFAVTTKATADVTTTPTFAPDERVLVLVSCKQNGADDADDDNTCVSQRVPFLESYLNGLGVLHRIVTTTLDFKTEMRSGRYDAYWVSGGAKKLMDDLAEEIREAAFRGETVILDGVHDQRNGDLDDVVGVDFRGKPTGATSVTLTGAMLPAGTFNVSGSKPIRVRLTTGLRQAKFNTGDPAIATNAYGYGSGLLFAFDLVGTLMAQPTLPLLHDVVDDALAYVTPAVPAAASGGAYVPLTITIKNTEPVAVDLDVTATLPAGFALAAGAPPATLNGDTVVWHVSLAAGASQDLEWAVRVPNASGSYAIPVALTQIYGGTSVPDGTASIPVQVNGLDTTLPGVIAQLQALALSGSDASARNGAVTLLQSAQSSINVANWEQAIDQLVDAAGKLDNVKAVSTKPYQAAVDNVLKEVEQRWWSALPACPATPPCR